jgi:hypothetical protein
MVDFQLLHPASGVMFNAEKKEVSRVPMFVCWVTSSADWELLSCCCPVPMSECAPKATTLPGLIVDENLSNQSTHKVVLQWKTPPKMLGSSGHDLSLHSHGQ